MQTHTAPNKCCDAPLSQGEPSPPECTSKIVEIELTHDAIKKAQVPLSLRHFTIELSIMYKEATGVVLPLFLVSDESAQLLRDCCVESPLPDSEWQWSPRVSSHSPLRERFGPGPFLMMKHCQNCTDLVSWVERDNSNVERGRGLFRQAGELLGVEVPQRNQNLVLLADGYNRRLIIVPTDYLVENGKLEPFTG